MLKLKNEFEQKLEHLIYEWPEAFACFSLLQDLRRHVDDSVDFWVSNKLRSHVHLMHLSSYHQENEWKTVNNWPSTCFKWDPNWNKSKSLKPTLIFV